MSSMPAAGMHDVCVIGSGPAGLASSIELASQGLKVVLLESGLDGTRTDAQALGDADVRTPESHSVMADAARRALGGTSSLWGGRCVPLDSIDFERRDYIPRSGWPLSSADLAPYYAKACELLTAGDPVFDIRRSASITASRGLTSALYFECEGVRATDLERWSREPALWNSALRERLRTLNVEIADGSTCVGFVHERQGGPVAAARLKRTFEPGAPEVHLRAKHYVIACGGVESTRLMLNSMEEPDGLKLLAPDLVGKYYMGHPSGRVATIRLRGNPAETLYGFELDRQTYVRRRLTFTEQMQRANALPNIAFWFDNAALADASHGSGILSAAYLALASPIGKLLAPEAIRKRVVGSRVRQPLAHLRNCVFNPVSTTVEVTKYLSQRYARQPRIPGFFVKSPTNHYAIHFHSEQIPSTSSLISLSEERDALGMRRASVELRWSDQDVDGVIRAHQKLGEALKKCGVGDLQFHVPLEQLPSLVHSESADGYHQIGTLRMAAHPGEGVTDHRGCVFGTSNLFVASSALFPTSGQANPTLSMVAMALRQASFIKSAIVGEKS